MDTKKFVVSSEHAVLMDVRIVAAMLDCSPRHVYRLADAGRLPPPVRLGALVRWPRHAIDKWLADGCPSVSRESQHDHTGM